MSENNSRNEPTVGIYELRLNKDALQYILNQLVQQPYREVQPILEVLGQQIKEIEDKWKEKEVIPNERSETMVAEE